MKTARTTLDQVRVGYLHGRPSPHPLHGRFAASVGAEFRFIDFRMRWHDLDRSRPYQVASWLVCAATLPERSAFDVFLIDGLHIGPVVMKALFLRRSQKIVTHMGSHTLYFLHVRRFSPWVHRLLTWALGRYDAIVCEGHMAQTLTRELLGERCPPTYVTFLGPPAERAAALRSNQPAFDAKRILVIGTGPGDFRRFYKGLDVMVAGFGLAAARDPELEFDVVGGWDASIQEQVLAGLPEAVRSRVHFHGQVTDIDAFLSRAVLYLHCSRGDAFPTATIEAMAAGLVPIVSEWTGTREVVEQVDERLVCAIDPQAVSEKIEWFFGLPDGERRALSARGREVSDAYTEESATKHYRVTFARICRDLGILT